MVRTTFEVYIMTAHWIYVIPLSIAYLVRYIHNKTKTILRVLLVLLTLYLMVYNGSLLIKYLYF